MPRASRSVHSLPPLRPNPSILFVTATRIGDAVLSTGLLDELVRRYPGARFTIAAGVIAAPLFRGVPGLERLIPLVKQPGGRHWLNLWRAVVRHRWDMVIDLRGSGLAFLLRAGNRRIAAKPRPNEHRVAQLGALLGLDPPPAPRIWIPRPEALAGEERLRRAGAVIGIGPTANWPGKIWRPERFVALIQQLTGPGGLFDGATVAVFAAPHERSLAGTLLEAIPLDRLADCTQESDLLAVAGLLARVRLFIGNDSGLMHLAAACGTPTLGLFGPSLPAHYAPWGPRAAYVTTEIPYEALVGAPDFSWRTTETLMDSLSVDRVKAAVQSLVSTLRLPVSASVP